MALRTVNMIRISPHEKEVLDFARRCGFMTKYVNRKDDIPHYLMDTPEFRIARAHLDLCTAIEKCREAFGLTPLRIDCAVKDALETLHSHRNDVDFDALCHVVAEAFETIGRPEFHGIGNACGRSLRAMHDCWNALCHHRGKALCQAS